MGVLKKSPVKTKSKKAPSSTALKSKKAPVKKSPAKAPGRRAVAAAPESPRVKAPAFAAASTDGRTIKLSDLKGQVVVLFFYPKDMTSGCTQEAHDFQDRLVKFKSLGAQVFGISKDSLVSHQKFQAKEGLKVPLLSDPDGKMIEAFGAWVEKSMYGRKYMGIDRSTFIIDRQGRIAEAYRKVKVAGHVEAVLARTAQVAAG